MRFIGIMPALITPLTAEGKLNRAKQKAEMLVNLQKAGLKL